MPRPGASVFHPRFSEHHRPVARSSMTARVRLTRDVPGGVYDPATLKTTPAADSVLADRLPARVQAMPANNRVVNNGAQVLTLRGYLVTLPHDAPALQVADLVIVQDADDAGLIGRSLRILDVAYGSQQWERDVLAEDNLG